MLDKRITTGEMKIRSDACELVESQFFLIQLSSHGCSNDMSVNHNEIK